MFGSHISSSISIEVFFTNVNNHISVFGLQGAAWPVSSIWQTTASLPLPLAAIDFDCPVSLLVRFQELTQVWVIDPSLLLDCTSGTAHFNMLLFIEA